MRIRTLKPELLTDEKTAALPDPEWRLFVSCILMADDYGNFRSSPAALRAQAFWGTDTSLDRVAKARETLARLSLVSLYEVNGQSYGHVIGWAKHQRVDHPGKPYCPGPEIAKSTTCEDFSRESRETSAKIPESLAPDREREEEREEERDRSRGPVLPNTAHNLKHCLTVEMQKRRPELCPYSPGPWADREADQLLRDLGGAPAAPEVAKRIALFVADESMDPWTVKKFCQEYNGIGHTKQLPGQPRQARY
jgi:hypothetical protein